MLGPFEVREILGRGGMGVVFLGHHLSQDVDVAIKVITRRGAELPYYRAALENEVRAVATLNHPGIVRILDYGTINDEAEILTGGEFKAGSPYFVMENLEGGTLSRVAGKLTWKQVRAVLLTILDALAHAHALDVVHRDLKPGNILLGEFGGRMIPRLVDFGLAIATERKFFARRSVGTPHYMAPEQFEQPWRNHGPWSDLYSLGCIAYELICGKRAVSGATVHNLMEAHIAGDHRPISTVLRLPDGFEAWLEHMMAPEYTRRFQSAAEAARLLMQIDDAGVGDVRPPDATSMPIGGVTPVLDVYRVSPDEGDEGDSFGRTWTTLGSGVAVEAIPQTWAGPRFSRAPMKVVGAGLGLFGLRRIPLVGRDDELTFLWRRLREVSGERMPQTVIIRSTGGTGKSHLVEWFVQRVRELGIAHVLDASPSKDRGRIDPIARMVSGYFRTVGATASEASLIVREELERLGVFDSYRHRALTRLASAFGGQDQDDDAFEFSTPRQRHAVVRSLLESLSAEAPVVLVFDDAYLDSDVWQLTQVVSRAGVRALTILVVTDEELATQPELAALVDEVTADPKSDVMELAPMSAVEHEAMITEVANLEPDLTLELSERTLGHPRMAIELIGDWVARGVLEVGETGFVLSSGALAMIPDSMHEVWTARIDEVVEHHGENARVALELAAALGHEVDLSEWAVLCEQSRVKVAQDSGGKQTGMSGMRDAGGLDLVGSLLERRLARKTETGWAFAHAVLRESLIRSAREQGRWRDHVMRCAYLVETTYDSTRPSVAERLGRYLMEAGEFERALTPLEMGAVGRRDLGEYSASQRLMSEYMRALERLGVPYEDPRWGRAWSYRSRVFINAGRPQEARKWGERALRAAESQGWTRVEIEARVWTAAALTWLGDSEAGERVGEAWEALNTFDGEVNPAVYGFQAYLLTSQGRFDEARTLLNRVLENPDEHTPREIAHSHHHRCRLAIFEKDWETALHHSHAAFELFESMGHYPAMASALEYAAEVKRLSGDVDGAREIYARCIDLQESIGYPASLSQINLASIELDSGDYDRSETLYMLALESLRSAKRRRAIVTATAGLCAALSGRGRWDAAASLREDIREMFDEAMESEPDIGKLLFKAGGLGAEASMPYHAEEAYRLALRQFEHLGDATRVEETEARLESLESFGFEDL